MRSVVVRTKQYAGEVGMEGWLLFCIKESEKTFKRRNDGSET